MAAQTPVPFGLDPTTFALAVSIAVLLANRVIEALIPKGSRFKFIKRFLDVPQRDDEGEEEGDK